MLFQVWYVGAIGTLIFLWLFLTWGQLRPDFRTMVRNGGGFVKLSIFCVPLSALWPITMFSLLKFIKNHKAAQ